MTCPHCGQETHNAKIRAAELLGKSVGLFKDVQVQEVARTAREIQADTYRSAYNTLRMNDNSIRREASRLMTNPKVATTVAKLQQFLLPEAG